MLRPSGSAATPVCCSTVTPGKFATFWRSPVSRLKRVVFPELGGPIRATAVGAALPRGISTTAAAPQELQSLHPATGISLGGRRTPDFQPPGRFAAQRDFRTIHLKDPRIAARSAEAGRDSGARQETKLHQAARVVAGKIDAIEHCVVAAAQVKEGGGGDFRLDAIATQLHLGFSMPESEILVNRPAGRAPIFSAMQGRKLSKWQKM